MNLIKVRCPVCGREYKYKQGGYKPKTCSNFDCAWSYNHHPEKHKPLLELADESRKKAGI